MSVVGELKTGVWNSLFKRDKWLGPSSTPPALQGKEWMFGEYTEAVIIGGHHHCPHCYGTVFTTHGSKGDYHDTVEYECMTCHIYWKATLGQSGKSWKFEWYGEGYNELRTAVRVTRAKEGL